MLKNDANCRMQTRQKLARKCVRCIRNIRRLNAQTICALNNTFKNGTGDESLRDSQRVPGFYIELFVLCFLFFRDMLRTKNNDEYIY